MKKYIFTRGILAIAILFLCMVSLPNHESFDFSLEKSSPFSVEDYIPIHSNSYKNRAISKVLKSTVEIKKILPNDGKVIVGSGVILETNKLGRLLLTAEHVAVSIWPDPVLLCPVTSDNCVELRNSFLMEADNSFLASDWAIYKIEDDIEDIIPASLNEKDLPLGEDLWLIGSPWGQGPWLSKGHLAWKMYKEDKLMYLVQGFAAPGFSGGGVFDMQGRLVGITVAIKAVPGAGLQVNQVLVVPLQNIWLLSE